LAAESLINGTSYADAWQQALRPGLRTGVVNRFLFNVAGRRGIDFLIRQLGRSETGGMLARAYSSSVPKRLLFPLARHRYRGQLNDPSCNHQNCDCVWCQHGEHETSTMVAQW
ncbi:MAG: hypothetical protein V7741_11280, partial [Hyphomonas sp.]